MMNLSKPLFFKNILVSFLYPAIKKTKYLHRTNNLCIYDNKIVGKDQFVLRIAELQDILHSIILLLDFRLDIFEFRQLKVMLFDCLLFILNYFLRLYLNLRWGLLFISIQHL